MHSLLPMQNPAPPALPCSAPRRFGALMIVSLVAILAILSFGAVGAERPNRCCGLRLPFRLGDLALAFAAPVPAAVRAGGFDSDIAHPLAHRLL